MKKGDFFILVVCLVLAITVMPASANVDPDVLEEKETMLIQPRFTNISVFYNDFYITDQGKAVLISSIDARNVDKCKISMYLQKYQNGSWITVKNWSATENGTFCGIGETWYVMSDYQYRMVSYAYVYLDNNLLEQTTYVSRTQIY